MTTRLTATRRGARVEWLRTKPPASRGGFSQSSTKLVRRRARRAAWTDLLGNGLRFDHRGLNDRWQRERRGRFGDEWRGRFRRESTAFPALIGIAVQSHIEAGET